MKFSCEKNIMLRELSVAQEIISSRNALSVMSNVFIEAVEGGLTLRATDLKVSFETQIPALVEAVGNTTVFCDKLLGIVRSLPEGEIVFDQERDERLSIKPTKRDVLFELNCISSETFPELQTIEDDRYFQISQNNFNEMVSQTIFSVSSDESRYFLNGVYFEREEKGLLMVGTDGRRLSYINVEEEGEDIPDFKGVIIPPKILNLVRKLSSGEGNISLAITDKTIFIKFDNQKLVSTLIEGQFPNFKRVIPENQDWEVILNKLELSEAIKRVSLLAEQKSNRVFLNFGEGGLHLKSEESDVGVADEHISCEYKGEEIHLAVNHLFLREPLRAIREERVKLEFSSGANKAMVLRSEPQGDYFHIIMPMQID